MKTRTNQPVVAKGTPTGEIDKVLGISSSGEIVKGEVSGGTKLYQHEIKLENGKYLIVISPSNEVCNGMIKVKTLLYHCVEARFSTGVGANDSNVYTPVVVKMSGSITKNYDIYYISSWSGAVPTYSQLTYTTTTTGITDNVTEL